MKKETCERCNGAGFVMLEDGRLDCYHCRATGWQTSKPRNYEAEQAEFERRELELILGPEED